MAGGEWVWETVRFDGESEGYGGAVSERDVGSGIGDGDGDHCDGERKSHWVGWGKGVLVGKNKAGALKDVFGDFQPHLGLGDRFTDADFMSLCKVCIILLILK